jgi:hypothetical protein
MRRIQCRSALPSLLGAAAVAAFLFGATGPVRADAMDGSSQPTSAAKPIGAGQVPPSYTSMQAAPPAGGDTTLPATRLYSTEAQQTGRRPVPDDLRCRGR